MGMRGTGNKPRGGVACQGMITPGRDAFLRPWAQAPTTTIPNTTAMIVPINKPLEHPDLGCMSGLRELQSAAGASDDSVRSQQRHRQAHLSDRQLRTYYLTDVCPASGRSGQVRDPPLFSGMFPSLGTFAGFTISTHATFVLLGTIVALVISWREVRRRQNDQEQFFWIIVVGLLGGGIGSRLAFIWGYVATTPQPSLLGFLLVGGRSLVGGLAGAYLGVALTRRWLGHDQPTGDVFVEGVALGMGVGRIGCLLTEQIGTATTLPWGVRLSPAVATRVPHCPECAAGVAMHPSFAYEILVLLALYALLRRLRGSKSIGPIVLAEGDRFKLFLLLYACFRFFLEFVRGNAALAWGLSGSQLFLIPSTVALIIYFALHIRRAETFSTAAVRESRP